MQAFEVQNLPPENSRNRMGPPERKGMTITEILENDNWSLAEGEENGRPLYIRFRGDFAQRPDVSSFPRLIQIVWTYTPDENGLPDPESIPRLKAFESRLVEAVQPSGIAVLVAAITNDGKREWMLYASSSSAFERCLNEIQEGEDLYPIDVTAAPDPKWTAFYDEVLGEVSA